MRMQAGMALPVTPIIDQTGYQIISLAGSSLFEVLIRHCQEDPWAGLDMWSNRCRTRPCAAAAARTAR